MPKPTILLQLDSDAQPSSFDAVVAIDAGAQHLLRYGGMKPDQVRELVYGAIFTRGTDDLRSTAIFIGGSQASAAEALFEAVLGTFFGPMRVSVMLDPNGASTTAAAAVLSAAERHLPLAGAEVLVLAATGPVGSRVTRLLAAEGSRVRVGSRDKKRAAAVCAAAAKRAPAAALAPYATGSAAEVAAALDGVQVVIAAGAPGVELLSAAARRSCQSLKVAIDLSAVPPLGIEGVGTTDRGEVRDGVVRYGAIGVGGLKMKIHKLAIRQLFESNDQVLDAEQIMSVGKALAG